MSVVAVHADARCAAPADRVFAILTDWPRQAEWMPFTRTRGGHGVGAEVVGRTGVGPFRVRDSMIITGWRPGHRVTVRHTGRLVRGEAFFEVTPLPGGSRIRWMERLDLPLGLLGRAGWLAAGPAFRGFMTLGLGRLAALSEA